MKQSKKLWLLSLIAVLIVGTVSWIVHMETHYGSSTLVPMDMTAEEILEEMPALEITEEDKALYRAVLSMPQVQSALTEEKQLGSDSDLVEISPSEALTALHPFLPDSYTEILELSVTGGASTYLSVLHGPQQRTIWHFHDGTISKTIAVYDVHEGDTPDLKAAYSNDSDGIQKEVMKHLWFSWLAS
ncbi:hypothetical protein [Angelakisella massiliensis]|uniref:hypothetical protein n=1 Tax=Angelakisella massiliensis TaxID=1871018 RepID=UPI0008F82DEC|nr:hypothetical protein [Angelakisella massiliensis]